MQKLRVQAEEVPGDTSFPLCKLMLVLHCEVHPCAKAQEHGPFGDLHRHPPMETLCPIPDSDCACCQQV